ncbi:MAG: adenylate/guanylate cyclase domain-containing protein, partial [Alphaproteobacteria bacterium]|nr:adenylate/guanylate cyclase domain-containing protein [Alphaproteobacteria bacterium]
ALVFDPVTHTSIFLAVSGDETSERRALSLVFSDEHANKGAQQIRPGPMRIALDNRSRRRVLPAVWSPDAAFHAVLQRRRPYLSATRVFSNQTFRDIYRTDTIDPNQHLKITSLTFLFTDLKGSTELYQRVGDLAAFDLVQAHFRLLNEIVAGEAGAVVKTIGDAVMATFPTPDRAVAAALRIREAMRALNTERGGEDLLLKIGIHEGPCLAVVLNERQDYFGQTVNIASRVQGLAASRAIYATGTVVDHPKTAHLLAASGVRPMAQHRELRGIPEAVPVYEIP